jgi:CheY-like chemotaxis protein
MHWLQRRINSESTIDAESSRSTPSHDVELGPTKEKASRPAPQLSDISENSEIEDIGIVKTKYFNWLEIDQNTLHPFLVSQSSKSTLIVVNIALTITFGLYLLQMLFSGSGSEVGVVMLTARIIRFTSCAFAWLHLYFIKQGETSAKKAIFCADQFILWSSITGVLLLLVRALNGACDEDQLEDTCNPRHDDNGLPTDTLIANLFMISVLPVMFKAHKFTLIVVSYSVTFFGLIAAVIISKASADVLLIFACFLSFGIMIYDHDRNMITMFLLIQNQQSYYDRLLAGERAKATAEIEKDELRNLIGSVAHDLKTPLHALMGELDGLQAEVNAIKQQLIGLTLLQSPAVTTHTNIITARSADAQNYIDSLRDIYQFMVMAINRAIEFRKTAAGLALLASNETFHLSKAVEWAVDRFSSNPSGVPIRVEMSPVLHECCPFLITDKHWMTENILTLLSNSCKFTSKGEIVLRLSLVSDEMKKGEKSENPRTLDKAYSFAIVEELDVCIGRGHGQSGGVNAEWMSNHPDADYFVQVEVEDSGIGVQNDAVHNLFRPFGKCQRRAGGTGLGLFSLSKRTEVLKGQCGMHKRPDGRSGSCFWFSFPYVPDSTAWTDSGTTTDPGDMTTSKLQREDSQRVNVVAKLKESEVSTSRKASDIRVVLVVDDSALILKATSRMLIKEGFEVETAQNGEEALELLRNNAYFFVLSDIQMPVMDGLEMAQRIRQLEKDESTMLLRPHYIVGMSANSDAETRDDSLASGMNFFIPKPVRMNELVKVIPH